MLGLGLGHGTEILALPLALRPSGLDLETSSLDLETPGLGLAI